MAGRLGVLLQAWRVGAIMAAALTLAACDKGKGEIYQRPPSEVRELLWTVEVPLYMFGDTADTQATVDASNHATVVWKITADESPLMEFTATLQSEGDSKTRVVVDVEGSRTGKFGRIHAQLEKGKEVRALYLVSMTEAVDSTLDGRAYDITRTYPALVAAQIANADLLFPKRSIGRDPQSAESPR